MRGSRNSDPGSDNRPGLGDHRGGRQRQTAEGGGRWHELRIVISTQGSLGDLLPYLEIGAELRRRGHAVAVGAANQFGRRIEDAGLEHRPVRPHVSLGEPRWVRMLRADDRHGLERFIAEVVVPELPDHLADSEKVLADADLVVTHPMSLGAAIVAELRGLPRVSTVLTPWLFVSAHEPARFAGYPLVSSLYTHFAWMRPMLRKAVLARTRQSAQPVIRLRQSLGLSGEPNPLYDGLFSADLVLGLFSSLLASPQRDWPANTKVTGFSHSQDPAALPDGLAEFLERGPAPVVFTLGSSYAHDPGDFYAESLAAARECGLRAVLLAPPTAGAPTDLGPDVHVEPFADHRALFPRAAAVVCSAGIGSLAAALSSGRPFIAVPDGVDQPDNAYRCARMGLCRVLPRSRYARGRVSKLLTGVLADPSFSMRSARAVAHLAGETGATSACDAIDALIDGSLNGSPGRGSRS
jgi:UDP:flavonoid glycosyltransferase YjiC (YdhE family)